MLGHIPFRFQFLFHHQLLNVNPVSLLERLPEVSFQVIVHNLEFSTNYAHKKISNEHMTHYEVAEKVKCDM